MEHGKGDDAPSGNRKYSSRHLSIGRYTQNINKICRKLPVRHAIVLLFTVVLLLYFLMYRRLVSNVDLLPDEIMDDNEWLQFRALKLGRNINGVPNGYLVFTRGCQIPDYNPFKQQVMQFYYKQKYVECKPNEKPLTDLVHEYKKDNDSVHFVIDDKAKTKIFGPKPITCCYYELFSKGGNSINTPNKNFKSSECIAFNATFQLKPFIEYMLVKCIDIEDVSSIYVNMHFVIKTRSEIEDRIQRFNKKRSQKPLSVLMIGIDGISAHNLVRSMQKTRTYLNNNKWYELMGYNIIADGKFPNRMAILSGYNRATTYSKCNPAIRGKLDQCALIWKDFHECGYVTAYAEDQPKLGFNLFKKGFVNQPTDYFMQPLILAAEINIATERKRGTNVYTGYNHNVDYIFDYGVKFAQTFKKKPYFGLFWVNSFTKAGLCDPSSIDLKVYKYLSKLDETGVLDESMVIFFSDHGMRYKEMHKFKIGWYEERLPFMFISLPKWFQNHNPEFAQSLYINQNRLTNPYDIHMTLKHILKISNPVYGAKTYNYEADSCKQCQSLFYQIPKNRNCLDANIDPDLCTCKKFQKIDLSSRFIEIGLEHIILYINTAILGNYTASTGLTPKGLDLGKACSKLELASVKSVEGTIELENVIEHYMVVFQTKPGDGVFEMILTYRKYSNEFGIFGPISRLNEYGNQGDCVKKEQIKQFCYCVDLMQDG